MEYKRYRTYRLLIVMALAASIGFFVSAGNYVLPMLAFVIACGSCFS